MHQSDREGSSAAQALDGLRVLDVGTFIAAPFSATLLAEFGADVIKVEEPGAGDSLRRLAEQARGEGLWWLQESRNKRVITCDLRVPEGQELLCRLVEHVDVLVENFRPGTMERWNLGYERLSAINPGLIMMRISGYGQTGPAASKPGFGRTAQAFGGLTYLAGYPDRPPVVPGSATIADYVAGLYGAVSVLIALRHRDRTGEGQVIDISLYESVFRILDTLAVVYDQLGVVRERSAFDAPHAAPHSHYRTADGRFVAVACTNDKIFARLCDAMGSPELLDDPRFGTVRDRVTHRSEIDAIVEAFTSARDADELITLFDKHEVASSLINSVVDIFSDPHVQSRETLIEVEHPLLGIVRMPGVVPRMSRTPGAIRHPGRPLGADTDAVLGELLAMTEAELSELRERKVI